MPYGSIRLGARGVAALAVFGAASLAPAPTQTAIANGETRTLTLYHAHTQESATVTFRRYGSYDQAALQKLNWLLRDWRRDEPTNMDPRLFDVLWETHREAGSGAAIRVVSAYRSPETNGMLRRRSRAVAKQSQHMVGKAVDFHLPDVSMGRVREIGMRLQRGGVGYYPTAGTPFVHLDVGSVRSWPRMPRQQLERLFPDGMTVHLPADGTPLANYQAALAMIQTRGGSAFSYEDVTGPRRSLWAMLFGGEDGELEEVGPSRRGQKGGQRVAARQGVQQVAALDSSSVYAVGAVAAPEPEAPVIAVAPPRGRAPAPQPKPEAAEEAAPAQEARPAAVAALAPASVPVPPRRPAGLKETEAEAAIAAAVPLPPSRPTAFAEVAGGIGAQTDLPGAIRAGAATPPALVAVNVPLPPGRPATPEAASPPARIEVARAEPVRAEGRAPPQSDAARLDALMASVVAGSVKDARPEKVPLPSVGQSMRSTVIASRLGDNDPADSRRLMRGVIARPLDTAFVRRGD